jgi:hypothetical protein
MLGPKTPHRSKGRSDHWVPGSSGGRPRARALVERLVGGALPFASSVSSEPTVEVSTRRCKPTTAPVVGRRAHPSFALCRYAAAAQGISVAGKRTGKPTLQLVVSQDPSAKASRPTGISKRSTRYEHVKELPKRVRKELEQFFITTSEMTEKDVTIEGWEGPDRLENAHTPSFSRSGRHGSRREGLPSLPTTVSIFATTPSGCLAPPSDALRFWAERLKHRFHVGRLSVRQELLVNEVEHGLVFYRSASSHRRSPAFRVSIDQRSSRRALRIASFAA